MLRNSVAYGQGSGSILERVRCSGNELSLINCSLADYPDGIYYPCTHRDDAGVTCCKRLYYCCEHKLSLNHAVQCHTGDIRLQGATSHHRGRVEVCVNSIWGTVCDDIWDLTDSGVVCKQLGFSRFGMKLTPFKWLIVAKYYSWTWNSGSIAFTHAHYGQGSGPIHLDNVRCAGSEQRLIDCIHINNTSGPDCTHSEDASVACQQSILLCNSNYISVSFCLSLSYSHPLH